MYLLLLLLHAVVVAVS